MSNYSNTNVLATADWLSRTIKKNPEGLLLLAAGCALLLRSSNVVEQCRRLTGKAQSRVQTLIYEQPVAVALACLAAGAASAAALAGLNDTAGEIAGKQKEASGRARVGDSFAAQSGTDLLGADFQCEGEKSCEEGKAAKAMLDAEQRAVDDIRAGRPAPYYFTPPESTVPTPAASTSSSNDPDSAKK